MGVKVPRKKPRVFLLTVLYRLQKLLPMTRQSKFKFFLNLEWIFDRLSHEMSFKMYQPSDHPVRQRSKAFILDHISDTHRVLDLGCHKGDISFIVAQKAKEVVGIDFNQQAIEEAQKLYNKDNLTFYHREALDYLKNGERKFDVLILSHILEHLDDPKQFLLDFKNYFSLIYIELPDFDRYYLNHYRKDYKLKLVYSDDDHISEFDRDELNDLLKECDIVIEKSEYRYGLQKLWCRVGNVAIP